jgi:hypothetical protein
MQPTHKFVRAVGNRFEIDGQEFKFVGFNIRGLAHYGFNDFLPLSTVAQRTEVLAEAQAVGSRVVRIILPFFKVSDAELVNRLRIVLDNAVTYQQRVIVCFTDHFESIKLQHWSVYQDPPNYLTYLYVDKHQNKVLNPDFYARLYRGPFLTYVRTVVTAFKNHPAVFAWELTNEGSDYPDHEGFINFHNNMAAEIRAIDPNHMITAGIVSIAVVQFKTEAGNDKPARLYQNLDFITIHDYDPLAAADRELAQRLNKPFIIEEAGRNRQRAGFFRENMAYWFDHGTSGYMGWGFMPSKFDNQDGDVNVGIDRVLHGDYEEVTRLWKDWAATFPPAPPPASMSAPPPVPMSEYFVEDTRPANDPSLAHIPRLQTFTDIVTHFAPLEIDQRHGWQATPAGKACWKVVGFHVAAGEAVLRPKILDQNRQYLPGKLLHWHYPGAPAQLAYGGLPPYFNAGFSGKTKQEAIGVELVLNENHKVQPGQGGPDSIWVATGGTGPEFSDAVHKLGVRLPHNLVVSPIFQDTVKSGAPPEPPSPPPQTHEYYLAVVVGGVEVGRIPLSQAQTSQTHLTLYHGDVEVGRIPLNQNVTGQNYVALQDRNTNLGRAPW